MLFLWSNFINQYERVKPELKLHSVHLNILFDTKVCFWGLCQSVWCFQSKNVYTKCINNKEQLFGSQNTRVGEQKKNVVFFMRNSLMIINI